MSETHLQQLAQQYNPDDQDSCDALLEYMSQRRRGHRERPDEAYVIVYANTRGMNVDVARTVRLVNRWIETGKSTASLPLPPKGQIPVYKIGEARCTPASQTPSMNDTDDAVLQFIDNGYEPQDLGI